VGKTLLGTVLSKEIDCTFLVVTPKDVFNVANVELLFSIARRLAPIIIFFEDIDLVAPSRQEAISPALSELLLQIDGVLENNGVFIIATTNMPHIIEKALADRPGRIDRRILINPPNEAHRKRIFMIHLGNKIKLNPDIDLDKVIKQTEGFTGAHIRDLVHTSVMEFLKENGKPRQGFIEINKTHINKALKRIRTSSDKFKKMYV
jgi:transitional endoplasmic reticulum ATPase